MITLFPTKKSDPELAQFRPGLVFTFFNALAWQIGIGTPMVLFAEQLGAPPFQVGLACSFVFVLTPGQILPTALLFFGRVIAGAAVLSCRMARIHEEKGEPADPIMIGSAILRPFRAMTYLANLVEPGAPKQGGAR